MFVWTGFGLDRSVDGVFHCFAFRTPPKIQKIQLQEAFLNNSPNFKRETASEIQKTGRQEASTSKLRLFFEFHSITAKEQISGCLHSIVHRRMQPVEGPLGPGAERQKLILQLVVDLVDTSVEDLEVMRCWTWVHLGPQMLEVVVSEALGEVPPA